ncbi:MAG TPA: TolC family protein [Vicinamibacterales bacterium]|nr:TolC family protein [Vicinamibacterales bacterium]
MTRNVLTRLLLCTGLAGVAVPASAQKPADRVVTDEHVQELIRAAAERVGAQGGAPSAASLQAPVAGAAPVVALTLDDAVKLALDRNLDIAVQRLNPSTYDFAYSSLAAAYRPNLTSLVSLQSVTNPSTQTISGGLAGVGINTDTNTYNGGIAQNIRWGGGAFALTLNNNKQSTTSLNSLFNPSFNTNWSAQYTQPLLRNFRIDNTRQQLVVTRLNQDISEIQLQASIINTVSNVRNAYWDLVFATQSVDVARQSVALADRLVSDNQTRVEIGTMAPIDVVQAQSQAATQRQNLANVEGTRRTAEIALKRLIVNGTQDANWTATLSPVDRTEFVPQTIDIAAAVKRALENRTDLQQARKNLQVNAVTLKYLSNQTLPQADVVARYGVVGLGGEQFTGCSGTGVNRSCTGTVPGNYLDSLSSLLRQNYPTWSVQFNVSYPIGVSAQEATVARARIQENQVEAQLKQIELQIATDVTNAATNVQSNAERVQAAQAAREFAQRTLEAEQSKFEVGMSTNYFVVQAQRDLATAQNNELQAVLAYRKSLVEIERLQQTSLSTSNITILGR